MGVEAYLLFVLIFLIVKVACQSMRGYEKEGNNM